jgi:hypothetical protein
MMEQVIVEWRTDSPVAPEEVGAGSERASWCHRIHNVTHLLSYVGANGQDICCVFAAPDAEAVRRAGRQTGSPVHTVWTARVLAAPDAPLLPAEGNTTVIVGRRFSEPADFDALHAIEEKGGWCLQQHGVSHLRSYVAQDNRRSLCLYQAADAEAVRHAQRQVGMPYEQIWAATACLWAGAAAQ